MRAILFGLIGLCSLVAVAMAEEGDGGADWTPQPAPPVAERCGGGGG